MVELFLFPSPLAFALNLPIPSSTVANDPRSGGGEVEAFQRHVAELLLDFPGDDVLSLLWTRKLLDVFLICLEEFRVLLFNSGAQATPPPPPPLQPLDRLLADFFDCAVKALNVCNAVRDGVDQIRQWQKLLDIVLFALAAAASPEAERGPCAPRPSRTVHPKNRRERERDKPERARSNRERRKRGRDRESERQAARGRDIEREREREPQAHRFNARHVDSTALRSPRGCVVPSNRIVIEDYS
ncbi:hypothetical protein ACMD2_06604 [Ananas comosus]|uniref:Uncharacterized protein n=1 Tax=Ananas comosus TaxID=4615 RepID=A0A199W2V6_ANACO|nr:hypothetical protein ACMD2_06604 [Ananas comosus]